MNAYTIGVIVGLQKTAGSRGIMRLQRILAAVGKKSAAGKERIRDAMHRIIRGPRHKVRSRAMALQDVVGSQATGTPKEMASVADTLQTLKDYPKIRASLGHDVLIATPKAIERGAVPHSVIEQAVGGVFRGGGQGRIENIVKRIADWKAQAESPYW